MAARRAGARGATGTLARAAWRADRRLTTTRHGTPAVTIYSRTGCHLCEHALDALRRLRNEAAFELQVRDVDAEPALAERYGQAVPVVAVDGIEVSAGRFDAAAVRRAIRAAAVAGAAPAVDSNEARS